MQTSNFWAQARQYWQLNGFLMPPHNLPIPKARTGRIWVLGDGVVSPDAPDIETAVNNCKDGDTIVLTGPEDYDESGILTPAGVDNVSIIGSGNVPRSTRWRNSANADEPMITVRGTGWLFQHIYFAGATKQACIRFLKDATYNASESRVLGCVFNGGTCHIEHRAVAVSGNANIRIQGNRFIGARGGDFATPGACVSSGASGVGSTNVQIIDNEFYNCERMIAWAMSRSMIYGNKLQSVGHDGEASDTGKLNIGSFDGAAGNYNMVMHNVLGMAAASITNANGFQDGANSVWADNYADDAVDYGVPGA